MMQGNLSTPIKGPDRFQQLASDIYADFKAAFPENEVVYLTPGKENIKLYSDYLKLPFSNNKVTIGFNYDWETYNWYEKGYTMVALVYFNAYYLFSDVSGPGPYNLEANLISSIVFKSVEEGNELENIVYPGMEIGKVEHKYAEKFQEPQSAKYLMSSKFSVLPLYSELVSETKKGLAELKINLNKQ